jgi:phage baseplate assembly protein W
MLVKDINSKNWAIDINNPSEVVQGLADVNQCIYIILTTVKGSSPLRPEFGCSLWDYVDKPINFAIPNMIREIAAALQEYETRITIDSILYEIKNTSEINFTIKWTSNFGSSETSINVIT